MKNTGEKIFILGIVIAFAIAGILAFYSTIVAPPVDVTVNNLHKSSLEANINGFSETENTAFNDSIYNVVVDKLALYKSEAFMTDKEIDYQTKALVQKYLPIFTKLSHEKFRASTWRESDHKAMLERIAHLRTLKVDYGETSAVSDSFCDSLDKIENTIQLYNKACDAAKYKVFYSVNDAKSKIDTAEYYRTLNPLNNCKELVNKLSAVKVNIGKSHYNKVVSKVNELADYRNMTKKTFDNLVEIASDMIDEYNSICTMYRDYQSIESVSKKANEYYKEAIKYYTQEINIDTNNEWVSMSTPSYLYRAYQSTNYYQHNSTATMSFTIKGYESFTFYIRSDGEANYDYVRVGLNEKPIQDCNVFASTKGNPQSNTSFYSYKPVNLTSLQKDKTYTIYVTYKKDGSNNVGTDKGYVLIPYVND